MYNLGKLFAAPRRQDDAGWRKVELMVVNGWNGREWPVSPQMSLGEVKNSLRQWSEEHERLKRETNQQLGIEQRRTVARSRARKARTTLKRQRLEEERQRLYQQQVLEQAKRVNQAEK